jgi:hypothetical protein
MNFNKLLYCVAVLSPKTPVMREHFTRFYIEESKLQELRRKVAANVGKTSISYELYFGKRCNRPESNLDDAARSIADLIKKEHINNK